MLNTVWNIQNSWETGIWYFKPNLSSTSQSSRLRPVVLTHAMRFSCPVLCLQPGRAADQCLLTVTTTAFCWKLKSQVSVVKWWGLSPSSQALLVGWRLRPGCVSAENNVALIPPSSGPWGGGSSPGEGKPRGPQVVSPSTMFSPLEYSVTQKFAIIPSFRILALRFCLGGRREINM